MSYNEDNYGHNKNLASSANPTISSVSLGQNTLVIQGAGLQNSTQVKILNGANTIPLVISQVDATSVKVVTPSPLSLKIGTLYKLIVSTASADTTASFTYDLTTVPAGALAVGGNQLVVTSTGNVGIGVLSPGSALDIKGTGGLRLEGATSGYVGLQAPATANNVTWTLPAADGTTGQFLATNGAGTLSWASTVGGVSPWITSGSNIYYSSGNVGIGTTNPVGKLQIEVDGTYSTIINQSYSSIPTDSARIDLVHLRGAQASPLPIQAGDQLGNIAGKGYDGTAVVAGATIVMNAEENFTPTARGTNIVFNTRSLGTTAASEKVRITANGNVGIGTTAPAVPFQVNSSLQSTSNFSTWTLGQAQIGNASTLTSGSEAAVAIFSQPNPASNSTAQNVALLTDVAVPSSSALNYGTFSSASISARYNGTGTLTTQNGVAATAHNLSTGAITTDNAVYGYVLNSSSGTISNASSFLASLNNSGTGTMTNAYGLNIKSFLNSGGGIISNGYGVYIGTILGNSNYGVYQSSASNPNYFAGNVGIGTTSPAKLLHVGSASVATGTAVANFQNVDGTCTITPAASGSGIACSSDERLKENFEDVQGEYALNNILKLQAVTYNFKTSSPENRRTGYKAQEVQKIAPEFVRESDDGYLQVYYDAFIPWITESIKTLYNRITSVVSHQESQDRDIASVKAENADLKAKDAAKDKEISGLKERAQKSEKENTEIKARLERIEKMLQ